MHTEAFCRHFYRCKTCRMDPDDGRGDPLCPEGARLCDLMLARTLGDPEYILHLADEYAHDQYLRHKEELR